jgi:cytochrome P450
VERDAESDGTKEDNVTDLQIAAHVSDFVLAGSETTSTVLSTATYYMLKDQKVYETLAQEIRSAFDSPAKMNDSSCQDLAYLNAVCKEAMRIYAPVPLGTPREVPEGGDSVDGHFVPAGVCILHKDLLPSDHGLTRFGTDRSRNQPRGSKFGSRELLRTFPFQAGTMVERVQWLR